MRFSRRKNRAGVLYVVLVAVIVAAGAALWTANRNLEDGEVARRAANAQAEPASPPAGEERAAHGPQEPEDPADEALSVFRGTVKAGDTAGSMLQQWLSMAEIQELSDACADVFHLRRLREGRPYAVTVTAGSLSRFEYEIDNDQRLVADRSTGQFRARLEDIAHDVIVELVRGTIESNLFQAVADAGEGPTLAIALADVFAWEINFIRDLQPGDSFCLLVEKRFREGRFRNYGAMYAATFTNEGTTFEAYRFKDAAGQPHYYTGKGESVKRAFLKAPLAFNRISSTFSKNRMHPVLHVWRAHPGVDYAAPTGTPVKAVGAGEVTYRGWGQGAGNYVALRHGRGYETMYLHLSAFASGLKKGKSVRQGEVVGFVGSTGYATGPHLDFRMKKDGVYINPLKTLSPRTDPVSKKDFSEFQRVMDKWQDYLSGKRDPLLDAP